jgi:hypothetical protein
VERVIAIRSCRDDPLIYLFDQAVGDRVAAAVATWIEARCSKEAT